MPSDVTIRRLHWRAHHRGTKEADLLIGDFFDTHHASWNDDDCLLFGQMMEEQDVDIMAWAHGTAEVPERYRGSLMVALKQLDYIRIAR